MQAPQLQDLVHEGMEKRMEATIMGYFGITIKMHSFIHSQLTKGTEELTHF